MEQNTFAEKLKWLRAQRDMTQRDLADKTGISVPQIVRYEGGRSEPRLRTVMRLAHVLGVDAAELAPDLIEKTTSIDLSFSEEQYAQLEEAAAQRDCSIEELVIAAIEDARRRFLADPESKRKFDKHMKKVRNENPE